MVMILLGVGYGLNVSNKLILVGLPNCIVCFKLMLLLA